MDAHEPAGRPARAQMSYACEACRAAKVRCQSSPAPGVCLRCLDSKRECIFKTGPRTRRPRRSKLAAAPSPRPPSPPGPSQTFTIDVPMPAPDDPAASLETLRSSHEAFLAQLVPAADEDDGDRNPFAPLLTSGGTGAPSTPSLLFSHSPISTLTASSRGAAATTRPTPQPRFNLDSATSLLRAFVGRMLPRFPVTPLPPDVTVPALARDRPFLLLAALAAASNGPGGGGGEGSRGGSASSASPAPAPQGHGLYDEEFRRVLGLKFVSGGERTVELLAGLLVYVAWYPFHLRPRSRRAFQYMRMAVDVVRDLELDQPAPEPASSQGGAGGAGAAMLGEEGLAGARAYLACYYLSTSFEIGWSRGCSVAYTQWTATCCDVLEAGSEGDRTLAWLVRLQHLNEETARLRVTAASRTQSENQSSLMLKGIETQLREWRGRPEISSSPILTAAALFTGVFLHGAPLLRPPSAREPPPKHHRLPTPASSLPTGPAALEPSRLAACVAALRPLWAHLAALPRPDFAAFCAVDWGRFVMSVVLGFRLAFPLDPACCPGWDDAAARAALDLRGHLDGFIAAAGGGDGGGGARGRPGPPPGTLAATRAVLEVVKRKYDRRVALGAAQQQQQQLDRSARGCPVMDGSMEAYLPGWGGSYGFGAQADLGVARGLGLGLPAAPDAVGTDAYHDLWATLTAGWAESEEGAAELGMVQL